MREVDDVVPDSNVVSEVSPILEVLFKASSAQAFGSVFFDSAEHDVDVGLGFGEHRCGARVLIGQCGNDLRWKALGNFIDKTQHAARMAML